jgi:ActR/RegA family two-component response regulator
MLRMPSSNSPRLFVVDDDRAVLSLVGTTVTCLDVLRALRHVSPQCEPVVMTGYKDLATAVDAVKQSLPAGSELVPAPAAGGASQPAPLVDVAREHIVRTLEMVDGNKAVAARLLGVSRRALYRQLERHGLHRRVPARRAVGVLREVQQPQ